ncbi:hypothetical protein ACP8HI_07175 [Paenibacillus sp. FA6]|uniref:hypothetical protein n=1 Tax=Paenibacillus sp. FA6 TaxID=3413029 RepID=UPI003F65EBFC
MSKSLHQSSIIIYIGVSVFVFLFIVIGTDDMSKLSNIFEKMATVNFTISIGYGALLAAIAALASHNTSQDNKIKNELVTFVHVTIFYVLLNIIIFLISFLLDDNYIAVVGRLLIGFLVVILTLYSHLLLKLSVKLIY